ncbi:MAG: hypothetical protein ACJAU0_001489 [Flavobacteriales bacterium]|jgi:hypothetical protein
MGVPFLYHPYFEPHATGAFGISCNPFCNLMVFTGYGMSQLFSIPSYAKPVKVGID